MDVLEELREQKKNATDKIDLRKIRAAIRKELRKRGEYQPRVRRRLERDEDGSISAEEKDIRRSRQRASQEARELTEGAKAMRYWSSFDDLHGPNCWCGGCTTKIKNGVSPTPPYEAWVLVLAARGFPKNIEWVREAASKIRSRGQPKSNAGLVLRQLLRVTGYG